MSDDDLWRLPGPTRFARRIKAALEHGYSPVVAVPRSLHDDGWQEGLLRVVDRHVDHVVLEQEEERPPEAVVAEHFALAHIGPGDGAASELCRHANLAGRILVVSLRDGATARAWQPFVRRFVAAGRPLPLEERPTLLVFADGHHAAGYTSGEPLLLPLWWWGALDRLDTAIHVAERQAGGAAATIVRDAVVEVAGYDLRLATHLIGLWDGSCDTLPGLLSAYPHPPLARDVPDLPHSSTPLEAPPAGLADLWQEGLTDAWDHFPAYLHACVLLDSGRHPELRSRIWRAQLRSLMPLIDEERGRLAAWVKHEIRGPYVLPDPAEPRDLIEALHHHPWLRTWRGGHRRRLIYWLRDTRNALAHMQTLTADEIEQGLQLIAEDRSKG